MTLQPSWHCVANLGDADPLNHGGAFILVDKRGNYDPELIILEDEGEDEHGDPTLWRRHTVFMPPCWLALDEDGNRIVCNSTYHPTRPAVGFGNHASLRALASFTDSHIEDIARDISLGSICDRATVFRDILQYWGPRSEPEILSKREAARFCRTMLRQIKTAETWRDGWH